MNATDADLAAIEQASLDDIESFTRATPFAERALHPELAKRTVHADPQSARSRRAEMSALILVQLTGARAGRPTPEAKERQSDATVLDAFENAASLKGTP